MGEKCFCHLNGFAVKDATARKLINEIQQHGVSVIKQINGDTPLQFWVGTQEEYNHLSEIKEDCFYIVTDDTSFNDLLSEIEALKRVHGETVLWTGNHLYPFDGTLSIPVSSDAISKLSAIIVNNEYLKRIESDVFECCTVNYDGDIPHIVRKRVIYDRENEQLKIYPEGENEFYRDFGLRDDNGNVVFIHSGISNYPITQIIGVF